MDGIARPRFFEGQYVGADDLQTIVTYARTRHAQHLLAGHSWGIAAGMELLETPNPDGSVSVWLQPGYGWDGYGRSLLVTTPMPIATGQLTGKPSGAWFVWLAYTETQQDAARPSYGVCSGTDTFLRVGESVQVVVSGLLRLDQQQSGVVEAGTLRSDARLVRRLSDPNGPFLCDANVPEQSDNPLGGTANWLVPAGLIGWDGAAQQVVALTPDQKIGARLFRRNAGAVAEDIFAPDGLLRLRPHGIYPPPGAKDTDITATCNQLEPLTSDLVTLPDGRVAFDDLVWVEGNLRVLGNARLHGMKLELRALAGAEPNGSLFLRRNVGVGAAQNVEVALGVPPALGATNAFVVGPLKDPNALTLEVVPTFIVQADGRTQIGSNAGVPPPRMALDIKGDFGREDGPVTIHLMGSRIGDVGDAKLRITSAGGTTAFGDDKSTQQVGIRTETPGAGLALDVHGPIGVTSAPASLLLLGSQIRDTGDGVLRIRSGGGTVAFDGNDHVGIGTATPGTDLALDVNGKIGVTSNPAALSLLGSELRDQGDGILRIRSGGGTVTFDGADRIGINTTAPGAAFALDVNGAIGISSNPASIALLGSELRDQGDGILRIRSGGSVVTFDGGDLVGIGTAAPAVPLDVNGNARIAGNLTISGVILPGLSDRRLKKGIEPLTHSLSSLLALRGVTFEWTQDEMARHRPGRQMGLIADEVERVFPNWVVTGVDGMKAVAYPGFEALVVEALRELSHKVDALTAENAKLRQQLVAKPDRKQDVKTPNTRKSS